MKKKRIYLLIVSFLIFILLVPGSLSSAANVLFDGGFEQYPASRWWYYSEPIGGVFMNSTLNNQFFFDSLVMPAPLCGHGIYNVGKTTYPLDYRNGSVPSYQFTWPGGTFYWQAGVLGPWFPSFFPVTAYSYADIYLIDSQNNRTELLNNYQIAYGADWERKYGSTNLGAGTYTMYMGRGPSMEKSDAYFYKYQLFYDDVYVGASEPAHNACSDSPTDITPTFEPTQYGPTQSPTPMETPTGVMTPTPMVGYYQRSHTTTGDSSGSLMMCNAGDTLKGIMAYKTGGSNNFTHFYVYTTGGGLSYDQTYTGSPGGFVHVDEYATEHEMINRGLNSGHEFIHMPNYVSEGLCGGDYAACSSQSNAVYASVDGSSVTMTQLCYGDISPTATPTLTPTPGPSPTQTTKLGNCGFESGSAYWFFTPPSYVDLAGGPAGPQNAVAVPNNQSLPNIWQNFWWPVTQPIYIQGWSKGQTQVRIWNIYSNFQYAIVYTGIDADWVHWQTVLSLPMGYYRLELNTFLPEGSEGRFDGVTLAADNYLDDFYCSASTPTPGATSYVTPTPGPSLTPSLTMTPRTSRTPWGTMTQWPSGTPSLTATAANGQTETAMASITPGGSGGGSTQTPGPGQFVPPDQPPGGEGAPCQRPQTWQESLNIGWWLDYEVCDIKRFVSWGPINGATAVAIPTMFANKEPFRTLGDVSSGFRVMQTQVAGKAWNNTGYSGVGGDGDAINPSPDKIFKNFSTSPSSPWAIGGGINFSSSPDMAKFSVYCSTNLGTYLSSRLAEGLCFALNVTKAMGYLGWIQFLSNILLTLASVKVILSTIGFYGQFLSAPAATETKNG